MTVPRVEVIQQNEIFLSAVVRGDTAKVVEMLQRGAVANSFNQYGATPLHWAAAEDNVELVRVLVAHGANVNAKACDGCTPLHFACREDSTAAARALLEAGASATATNASGFAPIDQIYNDDEVPELVELLKAFGGGSTAGGAAVAATTLATPNHGAVHGESGTFFGGRDVPVVTEVSANGSTVFTTVLPEHAGATNPAPGRATATFSGGGERVSVDAAGGTFVGGGGGGEPPTRAFRALSLSGGGGGGAALSFSGGGDDGCMTFAMGASDDEANDDTASAGTVEVSVGGAGHTIAVGTDDLDGVAPPVLIVHDEDTAAEAAAVRRPDGRVEIAIG